MPDRPESKDGSEVTRKSAGTHFRRDHADLVQIALLLLVQNSRREIPASESAEREQKSKLSMALTSFLQACSGPAEGLENNPDAAKVWPQAVSILQMRDATQARRRPPTTRPPPDGTRQHAPPSHSARGVPTPSHCSALRLA